MLLVFQENLLQESTYALGARVSVPPVCAWGGANSEFVGEGAARDAALCDAIAAFHPGVNGVDAMPVEGRHFGVHHVLHRDLQNQDCIAILAHSYIYIYMINSP